MGVTCSNCGTDNTQDSAFCKKCGAHIKEPGDNPIRTIGKSTDITERKKAEEALQKSKAHLRRAQEVALRRREAILHAVSYTAEHLLKAPLWEDAVDLVLARLDQAAVESIAAM